MEEMMLIPLEDIRRIADAVRATDPDDDQLLVDMIEGETNAYDLIRDILAWQDERGAFIEANKVARQRLAERNRRFSAQIETGNRALLKIMAAMDVRKLEMPEVTLSIARKAQGIATEGPMETLQPQYTRAKVEPDRASIKAALMKGETLPGWTLDNGGETLRVKRT